VPGVDRATQDAASGDAPTTATRRGASSQPPKKLPFAPAVALAPMEGLTLRPFREAIEARGPVGAVWTEFVPAQAGISRKVARREVRPGTAFLVVQLLGRDPDRLALATARMVEAGAQAVDLNVGCPSKTVLKHGRGAALLQDPARLGQILQAMVKAAGGVPVSAKVRAGFDDEAAIGRVARVVEDAGCAFLTVHGRTCREGYAGRARLEACLAARRAVSIPVIANGDIRTAREAVRWLEHDEVDGVMLGRGAARNPWIFSQIAALRRGCEPPRPVGRDLVAFVRELRDRFAEEFGPRRERAVLAKLKEVLAYLGRAIPDDGEALAQARRAQTLPELEAALAPVVKLGELALGRREAET